MRSLLSVILYIILKHLNPELFAPRTSGNMSEYDPYVRRYIRLLNGLPRQQRSPQCKAVDLEDTQEMPRYDSGWHAPTDPLHLREGQDWREME